MRDQLDTLRKEWQDRAFQVSLMRPDAYDKWAADNPMPALGDSADDDEIDDDSTTLERNLLTGAHWSFFRDKRFTGQTIAPAAPLSRDNADDGEERDG